MVHQRGPRCQDPQRMKHMPVALWPEADREAFDRAFVASEDPFDDHGPGAHLKALTVASLKHNYRRWLGFMRDTEPEMLRTSPAERIAPERVRSFIEELRAT